MTGTEAVMDLTNFTGSERVVTFRCPGVLLSNGMTWVVRIFQHGSAVPTYLLVDDSLTSIIQASFSRGVRVDCPHRPSGDTGRSGGNRRLDV